MGVCCSILFCPKLQVSISSDLLTIFQSFTALFKEIQRKMPPKKEKNATRHRITGQHFIYLLIESKLEASKSCFVANRLKINKIRYRDRNTVNLWDENEVKLASFDQLYVLSGMATISVLRKAPKLRE